MGFFKSLLLIGIPFLGIATVSAFQLNNGLIIACRKMGQNFGMGYNYFKCILKLLSPETQKSAEIIQQYRKTNQHITMLNREIKQNLMKSKELLNEIIPEELQKNPLEKFKMKPDKPIQSPQINLQGSDLIQYTYDEIQRLKQKKIQNRIKDDFMNKI